MKKVRETVEQSDPSCLFDETRDEISETLRRLEFWLGYEIDHQLTIGSVLFGLQRTLASIQERSLFGSLEEWMQGFCAKHEPMGVKMSFSQLGVKPVMSEVVKNELMFVLQEACGNAVKHGAADVIQILFVYERDSFKVTISDNGMGMQPNALVSNDRVGSGLDSIKSRVGKLGGVAEFSNKLGVGTGFVVIVTLPGTSKNEVEDIDSDSVLGHELHDYLCPEMIGVVMLLAGVRRKLTEDESEMWYELQRAEESLTEYSVRFRSLSHALIE